VLELILKGKMMTEDGLDVRRALETDFKKSEVQRDELKYYEPLVHRGSCRVKEGLFRTESEQREFIKLGKSIRLSRTPLRSWWLITNLRSAIRSLFFHDATDPKRPETP
jgi:hypothetical protein